MGIIAVLHTWDEKLQAHFHLHCLVPAGALSSDQRCWIKARPNFLFPVKALSVVFRGKFLDLLQQAGAKGKIETTSELAAMGFLMTKAQPYLISFYSPSAGFARVRPRLPQTNSKPAPQDPNQGKTSGADLSHLSLAFLSLARFHPGPAAP
jgi:hypothetical protein